MIPVMVPERLKTGSRWVRLSTTLLLSAVAFTNHCPLVMVGRDYESDGGGQPPYRTEDGFCEKPHKKTGPCVLGDGTGSLWNGCRLLLSGQ